MTTFQRARSEETREIRRQAILDTAAQMLAEMPAGAITLNELSRRSRLAKSGFLKYFESREAVLLELLDRAWRQWTDDLAGRLADDRADRLADDGVDLAEPVQDRGAGLALALTETLARHPQLCDLLSAQAGVLEHNVSPDVAARYKKAAFANVAAFSALTRGRLPELGDAADQLCAQIIMATGAVWTHARPSASMLEAYDADPELAEHRMPFTPTLEKMLATLIAGAITIAGSPLSTGADLASAPAPVTG